MNLAPDYRIFAFGAAARPADMTAFMQRYAEVPAGYREIVKEMTGVVLLWKGRGALRLWGPEEAMAMDEAYGVSTSIPGAVPIGDNGGGALLIHGVGERGAGLYLVEAGSLFLDEDALWIAMDLHSLIERGDGAEAIFQFNPVADETLEGAPFFEEGEYR